MNQALVLKKLLIRKINKYIETSVLGENSNTYKNVIDTQKRKYLALEVSIFSIIQSTSHSTNIFETLTIYQGLC